MLSVEALRKPVTRNNAYAWLIEVMKSLGFETTGWQPGRIQRTTLTTIAGAVSDLAELGKAIVEFNYNDLSKGPPLTEFSRSRYDNERNKAVKTRGPMRLRSVALVPYTIQPGQLIAADSAGVEFRSVNPSPVVLPAGAPGSPAELQIEFEARLAGSHANVAFNTVTRLLTPLAGVTITNNVADPWYTVAGLDEESNESLQLRNATKWATLSLILVKEGFENVALSAGAIKVDIDDSNPRGAGTVDVYVAGQTDWLGSMQMAAIQEAFANRVLNTEAEWQDPWPPNSPSLVQVKHPSKQALTFTGTVYYDAAVDLATLKPAVRQALRDLVIRAPIGGYDFSPGPQNIVSLGDILESIEDVDRVKTASLSLTTNVSVAQRTLVVPPVDPDWGLTFVAVPGS